MRPNQLSTVIIAVAIGAALSGCTGSHQQSAADRAATGTTGPSPATTPTTTSTPAPSASSPTPSTASSKHPTTPTASSATLQVVVRPVTAGGQPGPGYRVTTENWGAGLSCLDGPSPVAVTADVRFCGLSVSNTVACWKSASPASILCLRDARSHTLIRTRTDTSFAPTARVVHPAPLTLLLDDGQRCQIRDGGAWNGVLAHPTWVGWYSCTGGDNVYGPRTGDGIFRYGSTWVVFTSRGDGPPESDSHPAPIIRHQVTVAYFVGTAA